MIQFSTILLSALVLVPSFAAFGDTDPRAKKNIEAIEKVLPEYEKAAKAAALGLDALPEKKSPHTQLAADAVELRIDAIRSVRTIIATSPNYLSWHLGETSLRQWKEGIDHFMVCIRSGDNPFKGATNGVRTCRSPIDGQLLFYVFRLPKDYDPKKRYPLDVELHSGAALTWRAGWIDGKPGSDPRQANKEERIWISPCGRGNNCYAGMGEVAVMDAIRDCQKHYSVDADRVVIGGASMGGTGGFRLATLHPDVFAAAHSLTGGPHYSVPKGDGRFDAMLLVDNLCNTGFCIWDAPKEGHYSTNHTFADGLRQRAKQHPGFYPNLELTDPNGGHGIIDRKLIAEGKEWLRQQKRNSHPKTVVYKSYNLRYDRAYWVTIDTIEDAAAPAHIEAELQDEGRLRIAVENVERFHLDLDAELVGERKEVMASVNSGAALRVPTGKDMYFTKSEGKFGLSPRRYPDGLVKKHGLSGPVQDTFMGEPVLMVHGKERPEKMIDEAVLRLFGQGDGGHTLHTPFLRKTDREVTEKDMARCNLVLFGTPSQNSLVKKIADRLPFRLLDDGVEVAGKSHRGPGVGVVLVYPNPLNPERYVLLMPEDYAGGSPWTYPDWMVVKNVKGPGGVRQQVLAQGMFDARWQLAK